MSGAHGSTHGDARPDLRARVCAALESAGFRDREQCLPLYGAGGCFAAVGGSRAGVNVTCDWWDASPMELGSLRTGVRAALLAAGYVVHAEPGRLYVPADTPPDAEAD